MHTKKVPWYLYFKNNMILHIFNSDLIKIVRRIEIECTIHSI